MARSNFIKELEAIDERNKQQRGYSGLLWDELMELVRRDPEGAVRSVEVFIEHAADIDGGARTVLQLAHGVAAAYQAVNGDDSLAVLVKRRTTELGLDDLSPRFNVHGAPDRDAIGGPRDLLVRVDAPTWRRADPYTVVRLIRCLQEGEDRPAQLRRCCGRLLIEFDGLSDDPREVWAVEEIREFLLRLVELIPEIAFYLNFDREHGMLWVLYQSLAEREVSTAEGVHIYHPTFLTAVLSTLIGMRSVCEEAQIDWLARAESILEEFPEDFRQEVLRRTTVPPCE